MDVPAYDDYTDYTFFLTGHLSHWNRAYFTVDGQAYCNAEQYMMLAKAQLFGDEQIAEKIAGTTDPAEHKRLGRAVRGFDPEVWERHKVSIVYEGNKAKYEQNEGLRRRLFDTAGTLLVEVNPHDIVWGIGLSEKDKDRFHRSKWRGENLLGRILTLIRDQMQAEQ